MCIDEFSIKDLMEAINSKPPKKSSTKVDIPGEKSKYDFGAIWHGDLYSKTISKSFGSYEKRLHYCMANDMRKRDYKILTVQFAPCSSKKKTSADVLKLPAGVLKTYKPKQSYILCKYKLLIRKSVLDKDFSYIQMLPEKYIEQARRIIEDA